MEPLEALEVLTSKLNPRKAQAFPLEEAPRGYLAGPVASVLPGTVDLAGGADVRRAAWNGYALLGGVEAGAECRILGTLTPGATLDPDGFPLEAGGGEEHDRDARQGKEGQGGRRRSSHGGAGATGGSVVEAAGIWRVETGAILPVEADRVLPVAHAVLVGTRRVRVLEPPRKGDGIAVSREKGRGHGARAGASVPEFPAGSCLDGRLRALLAARGAATVDLVSPFPVAFAALGDELVDLVAGGADSSAGTRQELTAFWLAEAITAHGLAAVPLGILPDSPTRIRDAILRALRKKVEVLLVIGGLGDGVTDRTAEALAMFGASILVNGLRIDGCRQLLFAKAQGMDIIGLSGRPLAAACGFDIFVRPALLARQGASRSLWDWSRHVWPLAAESSLSRTTDEAAPWCVRPTAFVSGDPGGGASLRVWEPESEYAPVSAGQEGWALWHPPSADRQSPGRKAAGGGGNLASRAYFQPLA